MIQGVLLSLGIWKVWEARTDWERARKQEASMIENQSLLPWEADAPEVKQYGMAEQNHGR